MRLYAPTGTRTTATDRNPSGIASGSDADPPAGVGTTIASYTCPAGRRAILTLCEAGYTVVTALAAGQSADDRLLFTPNGQATVPLCKLVFQAAAPVGTRDRVSTGQLQLSAGDNVIWIVGFTAGAGVIRGASGLQGIEYDA